MEEQGTEKAKAKHNRPSSILSTSLSLPPSSSTSGSPYRFNTNGLPVERVLIEQHKMHFKSTLDWDRAQKSYIWRSEPDLSRIKQIMGPVLSQIGLTAKHLTAEIFTLGSFNKTYLLTACHQSCSVNDTSRTGNTSFGDDTSSVDKIPCPGGTAKIQFLLRLALSVYPWYKTESEVATMEFLRLRTAIPIPRTYAFDSSANNPIGFEWILMEKLPGQPYKQLADKLNVSQKKTILKATASSTKELSRLTFDQIGSLYCNWDAPNTEFYLGPAIDMQFLKASRCLYQTTRGPFSTLAAYLTALLHLKLQELNDPHLQQRAHGALDLLAQIQTAADYDTYEPKTHSHPTRIANACRSLQRAISTSAFIATQPLTTHLRKPSFDASAVFVDARGNVSAVWGWDAVVALPECVVGTGAEVSRGPGLADDQAERVFGAKDGAKRKRGAGAVGRVIGVLAECVFSVEEDVGRVERLVGRLEEGGCLD